MTHANRNRNLRISMASVLLLAALGLGQAALREKDQGAVWPSASR